MANEFSDLYRRFEDEFRGSLVLQEPCLKRPPTSRHPRSRCISRADAAIRYK